MTGRARTITLAGAVLPPDGPLRDHTRPEPDRSEHYRDRYDRRTLFYDCVALPGGTTLFTAPRMLNLWPVFRAALRRQDGSRPRLRRQVLTRCEVIEAADPPDRLRLDLGAGPAPLGARTGLAADFAGRNALLCVSRDNDPDWIADWAGFHAARHGADALVLFDNGSSAYSPAALAETLEARTPLARILVASAPYPYGPVDGGKGLARPAFLQPALLNLARRDMLARARAVLSVDIDELVWNRHGGSVFDAAADRPNSMVKIHGRWAYPAPGAALPAPQRAHDHRAVPDRRCRQKWAAVPAGLLSRFGWGAHDVGGRLVKLAKKDPRFELIHCRGTSTGWKDLRFDLPERAPDAELAGFLSTAFPAEAAHG